MSDFTIKKGNRGNYTIIQNEIFDSELPLDTMGLFMFLLSLPNDWKLNITHLRNKFGIGKDKAYRMINELIEAGYVEKEEMREGGKFSSLVYVINETPVPLEPFPGFPDPVNQDAYKELNIQNTKFNKKRKNTKKEKWPKGFSEFWKEYPNKVGKGAAIKSFEKVIAEGTTLDELLTGLNAYKDHLEANTWLHCKHPTTWLNQQCWLDEHEQKDQGGLKLSEDEMREIFG